LSVNFFLAMIAALMATPDQTIVMECPMPRLCLVTLQVGLAVVSAQAFSSEPAQSEPRTEAAVLAASDDWLAAERRGDVVTLDRRLMPEYRDIEPNGHVHPRSALIAYAANLKNPSTLPPIQLAAEFRKAHPVIEKVVISGDTALISYHAPDQQSQEDVRSIDVFVYNQGMWRALVSTHNSHN
jgi:hypothetical protein